MRTLRVDLQENSYDIWFEKNFDAFGDALAQINAPQKLLVVTDTNVNELYGQEMMRLLSETGYDADLCVFSAGEQYKSMDTVLMICEACLRHKMDRSSMIIALGGGVTGDMAGFAASIFMRGIRFVQVPTTLLAQSDSSVGGKTGVDFSGSKNILGAFHQPKLVYVNVGTLKTLPEREFISGMGEVIKHGMIRDAAFFDYLEQNADKIKRLDEEALIYMAHVNCAIKAAVVAEDEKETGLRAILNFGHTIGHAMESAAHFTRTHGACVGTGMCAAAVLAHRRGMIPEDVVLRLKHILKLYGFDTEIDGVSAEEIYRYMQNDKKKANGRLKFVLPEKIGSVMITEDVTQEEIAYAVHSVLTGGKQS